jgi:hypothetical protein
VRSTLASLALSLVDFTLHVCVALHLGQHYWGRQQAIWALIMLALFANLVGIISWVFKNSSEPDGSPSEFSKKLQERPDECVLILVLGIVNTEGLCFLTENEGSHRTFRILELLRTLFEDVPIFFVLLSFLLEEPSHGHPVILLSFFVTLINGLLKLTRTVILSALGTSILTVEPKLQFFANCRHEDVVLLPAYCLSWVLVFILIVFLQYASYNKRFAQAWLSQQLIALGGYNATDAISYTLSNATLHSYEDYLQLRIFADTANNDTDIFGNCTAPPPPAAPPPFELGSGVLEAVDFGSGPDNLLNGTMMAGPYLCAFTIEKIVARVLIPTGKITDETMEMAERFLSPAAIELVEEWAWLFTRLSACFAVSVICFTLGMATGPALLVYYLRSPNHAESFRSRLMYRSSLTASAVLAFSMANAGFLNVFTQDRLGYSLVKRDSAMFHMCFLGLPMLAVAAAALGGFNCQHRACGGESFTLGGVEFGGRAIEYYMVFNLVVTVPLVWWHFLSFMTASVAVRSAREQKEKEAKGEVTSSTEAEKAEAELREPPISDANYSGSMFALGCFCASTVKWVMQLFLLIALFWNSPLSTRIIGGRTADEWLELGGGGGDSELSTSRPFQLWIEGAYYAALDPPKNVTLVGDVDSEFFSVGMVIWVLGMLVNVGAVGVYLAWYSTPHLRKAVEQKLALTAFTFTVSVVHPEALRALADRRTDVMWLRIFGALPALLLDLPIVVLSLRFLLTYGYNALVLCVGIVSLVHLLVYFFRAVVVAVTRGLLREAGPKDPNFVRYTFGDLINQFAMFLQFALSCCVVGLYYHGWKYGFSVGFSEEHVSACESSFYAASFVIVLSLLASCATSVSFLNHFVFSHAAISERSYWSSIVLGVSCIDASWLAALSEDTICVREVKRTASIVSIATLFFPMLVIQGALAFMAGVPFFMLDGYDEDTASDLYDISSERGSGYDRVVWQHIIAGNTVQNAALTMTVIVGVWKLLLLVMLHTTRQADAAAGMLITPFKHTPWVLGTQWYENRKPPLGYSDPQEIARQKMLAQTGRGRPTHHMGYAIDEHGNYIYDEEGNYAIAEGVNYTYDEWGNPAMDENGSYVLQDALGVTIVDGYGFDGFGGYVEIDAAASGGDSITNTSRSTDTYAGGASVADPNESWPSQQGGAQQGEGAAQQLVWATCPKSALTDWEGTPGVFVDLQDPTNPYMFLQVHQEEELKKSMFSRGTQNEQLRIAYMITDVGSLEAAYVEANIAADAVAARRAVDVAMGGGAPEDAGYYDAGGYDDGLAVDAAAYDAGGGLDAQAGADAADAVADADSAQRL